MFPPLQTIVFCVSALLLFGCKIVPVFSSLSILICIYFLSVPLTLCSQPWPRLIAHHGKRQHRSASLLCVLVLRFTNCASWLVWRLSQLFYGRHEWRAGVSRWRKDQRVLNYDVKSGQIKNKHKEGTSRDDVISCNYREYWGGSHD